jgi:hypothetical protein
MTRRPNEETPSPIVPDTYVPPGGTRYPVHSRENWAIIAASHSIDPWDLIDFNFPGLKRMNLSDIQRATRQTNWYLREYVGCNTTTDGENWAFTTGLTGGRGSWKGGVIYIPGKPPELPVHRCSPTGGSSWRRPTFYRTLSQEEQGLVSSVFGPTLPHWTTIGIGDGLGFGGQPWTDMVPMAYPQIPHLNFQINIGDAAGLDLRSKALTNCFVNDIPGTVAELLVHEMTHVWQYHNGKNCLDDSVSGSAALLPTRRGLTGGRGSRQGTPGIVTTWSNRRASSKSGTATRNKRPTSSIHTYDW